MKYRILDLDNCIADDRHRLPLINYSTSDMFVRYALYTAQAFADPCANRDLFESWPGRMIIINTGRYNAYREVTEKWLERMGVPYRVLCMRNNTDHRSSVELKKFNLQSLLSPEHWNIRLEDIADAYDDKQEIVDMYRLAGIHAERRCVYEEDLKLNLTDNKFQKESVPDLLRAAARTFEERNAIYGDNYRRIGALLIALFPEGGIPAITNPEDAERLAHMISSLTKLQRYAHSFQRGGHRDSAHDNIVYSAMLEEFTR